MAELYLKVEKSFTSVHTYMVKHRLPIHHVHVHVPTLVVHVAVFSCVYYQLEVWWNYPWFVGFTWRGILDILLQRSNLITDS